MLKIHYGIREKTVCNIRSYFQSVFQPEWLNNQLAKDMILDVDKSRAIAPYCIESPVFGQISPFMLSGGVKALLLMQNTGRVINASKCGDNCAK